MDRTGYGHEVTVRKGATSDLLPRVHRVVALLKRWLTGTHQGAVSPEHLDDYLDELSFRFNGRTSRSRGKLCSRLVQQVAAADPVPYKAMVKHARGRKPTSHKIWGLLESDTSGKAGA